MECLVISSHELECESGDHRTNLRLAKRVRDLPSLSHGSIEDVAIPGEGHPSYIEIVCDLLDQGALTEDALALGEECDDTFRDGSIMLPLQIREGVGAGGHLSTMPEIFSAICLAMLFVAAAFRVAVIFETSASTCLFNSPLTIAPSAQSMRGDGLL